MKIIDCDPLVMLGDRIWWPERGGWHIVTEFINSTSWNMIAEKDATTYQLHLDVLEIWAW